jgi:hypothetical protein
VINATEESITFEYSEDFSTEAIWIETCHTDPREKKAIRDWIASK